MSPPTSARCSSSCSPTWATRSTSTSTAPPSEAFLATAIRPQSVMYIADMLGYIPIGQHAASVTLTFKMNESLDPEHPLAPVTLPKGTRVHNTPDNANALIVFETQEALTIAPGG